MTLLSTTVQAIAPADEAARKAAAQRIDSLAMPPRALGRLCELAIDLAGMTGKIPPPVSRKLVTVMAGDHGVCSEGVSAFPQAVTVGIVATAAKGGAGINVLSGVCRADVLVVDMGVAGDLGFLRKEPLFLSCPVANGTANFASGLAMTRDQAKQAVETGIQIALDRADDYDVFATGEMGIGNTTPATAIVCAMAGCSAVEATGRGTGVDDAGLARKTKVIEAALLLHRPNPQDGLDVLSKVGGFEIGGLAGMILGAASRRKPVLIDGFISTSAALIAQALCPFSTDYMICAHRSVEVGHRAMLAKLGKEAFLDLGLRLGEGTGAALVMPMVDSAAGILHRMFTLPEAIAAGNLKLG